MSDALEPTMRVARVQHPERFMNRRQLEALVVELRAKLEAVELRAKLEAMEELKEAVEAFKADDTWKFDPAHIGRGLMTWGEVLTALAAAQEEKE